METRLCNMCKTTNVYDIDRNHFRKYLWHSTQFMKNNNLKNDWYNFQRLFNFRLLLTLKCTQISKTRPKMAFIRLPSKKWLSVKILKKASFSLSFLVKKSKISLKFGYGFYIPETLKQKDHSSSNYGPPNLLVCFTNFFIGQPNWT